MHFVNVLIQIMHIVCHDIVLMLIAALTLTFFNLPCTTISNAQLSFVFKWYTPGVVKTNTVVGIGVVVCSVVGTVGATVVSQGATVLLMFPSSAHIAIMQLPSPSVVW